MLNMFDEVCKRVSLLLFYKMKNFILDTKTFSYYFTFCNEIINYIVSLCPGVRSTINDTAQHNVNRIIESMKKEKLTY